MLTQSLQAGCLRSVYCIVSNGKWYNYVLAECTALAQVRGIARQKIIRFSTEILGTNAIEIVWVDEILHRQAVELTKERPDKNYSLCDAVSFVLMRRRNVSEALTTDKHFEQEGLIRLLK